MSSVEYERVKATTIMKSNGLVNVMDIFVAAGAENLELHVACALMEKESHGANVYGHDAGGALSGFPDPVNESNYRVFRWLVFDEGQTSNGVGPAQITFSGFFLQMEQEGLQPWRAIDNMRFGFRKLKQGHDQAVREGAKRPWVIAGEHYNGSRDYGLDLAAKIQEWEQRLAPAAL